MIYLLDINVLIGLALGNHSHHPRVARWIKSLSPENTRLASCAITELGLVRILLQLPEIDVSIEEAQNFLKKIKSMSTVPFMFLTDHLGVDSLPRWVRQAKQTTDGHLVALARSHEAVLATLDKKIPGSFLIPD